MLILHRWRLRKTNYKLSTLVFVGFFLAFLLWYFTPPARMVKEVEGWGEDADRDLSHYMETAREMLRPSTKCASRLQVVITSAPDHILHRRVLRKTWASPLPGVNVAFLVGRTSDPKIQELLEVESLVHGDIIQMSFIDNYNNLTLKSSFMLKWFLTTCVDTDYLLKADDDVIVNITNLLSVADSFGGKDFLAGRLFCRIPPITNIRSKWYCPQYMYRKDIYPIYLGGPGYIMNRGVAEKIYEMALLTPIFHLEDVYLTGIVASRLGVKRVGVVGMWSSRVEFGCHPNLVLVHGYSPSEIQESWHRRHNCSYTLFTIEEWFRPDSWCTVWEGFAKGRACPDKQSLTYHC